MYKLIITLLLFLGFNSFGQEKTNFSLFEAQEYALNNAEKIKNAQFDLEIAEKKVVETRAIGLPQVSATASFQNFLNLPVQVLDATFLNPNAAPGETVEFRAGTEFTANGTLQVNQLLFDGSYIVGLQVSKFYKEFVASTIEASQQDVLYNVTQAYQMVLVSKQNMQFIDSLLISTEELVEKQRNYFELGLMTKEDMDQLEFSLLNAQSSKTNALNQYNTAQNLLKMTMAYPLDQEIDVTEDLTSMLLSNSLTSEEGTIDNNINLQILEQQKVLSEYSLKNTKYANMPSLSAFFNHQYNAYRNEFNFFADEKWFPQTLWGIQMNVPIFSSGMRWAKTQQAAVEVLKNENSIVELKRALTFQEIQAENNFENAKERLSLQEKNVELAKSIYYNSIAKKEIGKGNSILVTQKYAQLVNTQTQYVGAMLDVFNSKLELDKLHDNLQKSN